MRTIEVSPDWIRRAVELVEDNEDHLRILQAYEELATRTMFTIDGTLHVLATFGLTIDLAALPSSLPHFLCSSLYTSQNPPISPSFAFRMESTHEIKIPVRSYLVLYYIAFRLNVAIFLFSGRARPLRFNPPSPRASFAFFHCIDGLGRVSSVHVLEASGGFERKPRAQHTPAETPPDTRIPPARWRATERGLGDRTSKVDYKEVTRQDCLECLQRVL